MAGPRPHAAAASPRGRGPAAVLTLALLLPAVGVSAQLPRTPLDCRRACVCASNIVSCPGANLASVPLALPPQTAVLDLSFNSLGRLRDDWTTVDLGRLHTLLLSHNELVFLSYEAFGHVTELRYLDLSSNGLRQLDEFIFEPLEHLEVLLLYNNRIAQIDHSAFSGLGSLRRLYLSHNQVARFPLELVKERSRLEALQLLDVSSNRIKVLPLHELQALPAWLKNGVYFHNLSLPCSCELYDVVAGWNLKELSSVTDFKSSHTCLLPGPQKERMPILDLDKAHLNCTEVTMTNEVAYLQQYLVLDCDTRQKDVTKSWVLPGNIPVSQANKSAEIRSDGGLQIGPLMVNDSGVYTCYATGDNMNETLHVTVVVFNSTVSGGLENLKTAYTTLVACIISVVMVFIYLFLTPCRCAFCPGQGLEKDKASDTPHSSTVSIPQAHRESRAEGGGFPYRQVAFLDPKDQLEQNGRLNPIHEEDEECKGFSGERKRSEAEAGGAPMVV
ncbi:amphoterin-induced protein 1-like [Betta splendens]|uniref:Amphoterin-induced protein 1-like n=1 Tax=Betta splendens TaxID=158456 RepID=A0A6P7MK79_BETSP|nr:amphoterin-induced protein 1-like [Betta splendens]XP_055364832.1 amphoterin-induced protein 1-like [Betta splendens]